MTGNFSQKAVSSVLKPLLLLSFILMFSILLAISAGAESVPFFDVLKIMRSQLPFVDLEGGSRIQEIIVLTIRLPRVLMAALIGGGLAITGATLQALFRNAMADPGMIGISSGGALAAVIAIATGFSGWHYLALPASAFLTLCLIYVVSARQDGTSITTLLLSGIAIGIFMGALISLVMSRTSSTESLREIFFWLMGGLDGRGWDHFSPG